MKRHNLASKILPHFSDLILDCDEIEHRLLRRMSLGEVFSIGLCVAVAGIAIWLNQSGLTGLYDFEVCMKINIGDYTDYYYPKWIDPVYNLLSFLPKYAAYGVLVILNIAGAYFAARVFKSPAALILISYQSLYNIFYGNITGLVVGGLGILWFGLASRKWWLAGIGLLLAGAKYQSGLLFAGLLLLYADLPWKEKAKVLVVPLLVFLATMVADFKWPLDLVERIMSAPPNTDGSLSLWRWLGPAALIFLIPPLVMRFPREERLLMALAAVPLTVPYFQQTDLLGLMVLPTGWLVALGGNISYTFPLLGHLGLQIAFVVPLGLYLFAFLRSIQSYRTRSVDVI
ncbi:MAG: hypothetical protein ACYC11_09605 [Bellilinea sp.]